MDQTQNMQGNEISFERSSNPIVSLWKFYANDIKMARIMMTGSLSFLLILLAVIVVLFILGSIILMSSFIILIVPALLFTIYFITYLINLLISPTYKLKGLSIYDNGIKFKYRGAEEFINYSDVIEMNYNPFLNLLGGATDMIRGRKSAISRGLSYNIFYSLKVKDSMGKEKEIKIPLDITDIDKAVEIISQKLDKSKVKIEFEAGKPSTNYIPGLTHPDFVNKPIGKLVLVVIVGFIILFWLLSKIGMLQPLLKLIYN